MLLSLWLGGLNFHPVVAKLRGDYIYRPHQETGAGILLKCPCGICGACAGQAFACNAEAFFVFFCAEFLPEGEGCFPGAEDFSDFCL